MAELRWAETALADLAAIRDYLSQHSSAAGRRFVAACFKRAESLSLFPQQGRMTPEAQREDIRELIVEDPIRPPGSPLFEEERHARRLTLIAHRPRPVRLHRTSGRPRLTTDQNPVDTTQIESP